MLRIRLAYEVKPELRFLSHLDLVRLFDRVFRRSGVPIAYTQGRTPRPRVSFGPPRAVGMASRAEYVDFTVQRGFTDADRRSLAAAMPSGLEVREARPLYGPRRSLEQEIDCGLYRVGLIDEAGPSPAFQGGELADAPRERLAAELEERAARFERSREVPFRRVTPKKAETINLRDTLLALEWTAGEGGSLDLRFLLALGGRGRARPVEVACGLLGLDARHAVLLRIDRLGLYRRGESGSLLDPFGDRMEAAAPSASTPHDRERRRLRLAAMAAPERRYGEL